MEYGEVSYIVGGLTYLLFCICFVFATNEFVSFGLTVESVFSGFIKNEKEDFVLHHIQRLCYTVMVHSLLPFGYTLLHMKLTSSSIEIFKLDFNNPWSKICLALYAHFSLLLPMTAYLYISYWKRGNFHCHPVRNKLQKFVNNVESSWHIVAVSVSNEFRRNDTLVLQCGSLNRVVITNSWIIKVSMYNLDFALQNEASLSCTSADIHNISFDGGHSVQYLNIEVKSSRRFVKPFSFRIKSHLFNDLNDRLRNTIVILPNVSFHKTRIQQFLEVFRTFIKNNPSYVVEGQTELCIGCMNIRSDVKLVKHCEDVQGETPCGNCQCRPMWCIDCMGKWFGLRQDENAPETWMSSKCSCPMCRVNFCLLDVCPVKNETETTNPPTST